MRSLSIACLTISLLLPGLAQAQAGARAEVAGLTFETLNADDLDIIQKNVGHRLGVQIVEVKPGSPGAAAGLKATDLLLAVGSTGVDSAEKAVAALQALKAPVELGTLTIENGTFVAQIRKFDPGKAASTAPAGPAAPTTESANEAAGLTFVTLPPKDLDDIQASLGYRVGVGIAAVKPGSPGAAAGLKTNDIVFMIGKTGVDSAEKAVAALRAATGTVDLPGMSQQGEEYEPKTFKITLTGQLGQPTGQIGQAQPKAGPAAVQTTDDPIEAYFAMMDFVRTQAWARKVTTGPDVRQRVAMELQAGWAQLDPQSQAVVLQIPSAWADLQKQWQGWNDQQKAKQRAEWQNQLISPGGLYPSPANAQQYTAPENLVAFQYPGDWTGGMTEADGTPLLWMGPGGSQAQWEQVLDTPRSPSGALFALAEVGAELQNLTYVQGAHYLAKLLIPNGLSSLRVVQEVPIGDVGAVIVLTGKFPGQTEDKFFWIGVTKFGADKVFAGRMGGTVREAETLVPAFNHLLQTLQLNPPAPPGGGGGVVGTWETAWSKVDTAIVKNIWAPSGN